MDEQEVMEQPLLVEEVSTEYSPTIGELVGALALAQLEFEAVKKDTANPYYNSKYADLADIIAATQPALAKYGLVVIQLPRVDISRQQATLISMLAHKSGEYIRSSMTFPASMRGKDGNPRFDAQSCGSAITYLRRYSYQPLVGVTAEIDDDGNKASGIGSKEAAQAVGQQKVGDLKSKKSAPNPKDYAPALFYTWFDESQTARIEGDPDLKTANRDLLGPLYNGAEKAIIANADQLEALKYQFEQRGVTFKLLKGENLAEKLKDSIDMLAKKKANGQLNAGS